jgi:hypothetical protein
MKNTMFCFRPYVWGDEDYFIDPIESSSVGIFQALTLNTQIMPLQKSIPPWTQKCMVVKLGRCL